MMKKYLVGITALVLVLALVIGCNGVPTSIQSKLPPGTGMLKVYVTDALGDIEECYVTIKGLEVHKTGGPWVTIYGDEPGQDPQEFEWVKLGTEDIDEFLTSAELDAGWYTQLRLDIEKVEIQVEVEGDVEPEYEYYDAKVPSGKIKLIGPFEVKDIEDAVTEITLDFDVEKSVHKIGAKDEEKPSYIFKPVIKLLVTEALEITTTELPNGIVGAVYNEPLEAIDGIEPYTWSITDGSLPPGLSLLSGVISGTPTATGLFTFTVQVTDESDPLQTHSKEFSITILAAPTVTNISPSTGPEAGGTEVTITGTGFVDGATVTIGVASANNVVFVNATSITAETPTGTAGAAQDVVVTNPDTQTGTLTGGFTYVIP